MMPRLRAPAAALLLTFCAGTARAQQPAAAVPSSDAYVVPALPPPAVVTRDEYARRRAALAGRMGEGVLVVFGADEPAASYLRFAQTPPRQYLAGVTEPGARL
ncbi:MAG TPA: hypothetical protein VM890_13165, partial [Longimicrobium sp.]|nr:hypothetical protein [Longimicrobium sp.]